MSFDKPEDTFKKNQCVECGRPNNGSKFCLVCTNEKLKKALEFYADPDSYFAITVWADPPCGSFIEDCSHCEELGRIAPGKLAREVLEEIE